MDVIIFKGFWTLEDVTKKPDYLFIFGDNDVKRGRGGQAIIRDLPNTAGIPTKKFPNNNPTSFYTDAEYESNITKIDTALAAILQKVKDDKYKGIVLPEKGFGTGLARLVTKAPNTLKYINTKIEELQKLSKPE
jgi:hypothetical protein